MEKFHDSMEFQSWEVNFRNEVCTRTADSQITMHWIKYELMTSRSIVGHDEFFDFDLLNSIIPSALKKLFLNMYIDFRKRVSKSSVLRNTTDSREEDELCT